MAEDQNKNEWRAELPEDDYEEERLRRKWEREQELKNTQRERRLREQRMKLRAIMILAGTAAFLIVLVTVLTVNVFIPLARYNKANKMLENGEYADAIVAFRGMSGYKDADILLEEAIRRQAVKLAGREDVRYETTASAPWFSINERGELSFDEDRYTGDRTIVIPDVFDGVLVETLSSKIFAHTDFISIEISDCVTVIEKYAFLSCQSLTEVKLSVHLTEIGASAFEDCPLIEGFTFGEELQIIGASAFAKCTSLSEVVLPSSLTALNSRAFNGCSALERVTVGGALETFGAYAFSACTLLETLTFRGTEEEWDALCTDPARVGLDGVSVVCSGLNE